MKHRTLVADLVTEFKTERPDRHRRRIPGWAPRSGSLA